MSSQIGLCRKALSAFITASAGTITLSMLQLMMLYQLLMPSEGGSTSSHLAMEWRQVMVFPNMPPYIEFTRKGLSTVITFIPISIPITIPCARWMSQNMLSQCGPLPECLMALSTNKRLQRSTFAVDRLYVISQRGRVGKCHFTKNALFPAISTVNPLVDPQISCIGKGLATSTKWTAIWLPVSLLVLLESP